MCTKASATWVFEDALHALWTAKNAGFKTVGIYDATSEDRQEDIKKISDVYMYEMSNFHEFIVKV
jgi:beta-phosphoglucomutase-like phosphatase (HAD superfamily)